MAAAQDKIIPFQVETLYSHWEQRQIFPVTPFRKGEILNEGSLNRHSFYDRRNRTWDVQKGIKIGLRKKFAKDFETPFPSSHPSEPIMDNGYPHRLVISLYSERRKKVVIARSKIPRLSLQG
jgi:hypothetical protein